ncbi:MAG TPA: hypothetical protein VIT65_09065 [Microlunatus sp.]
MPAALAGWDAVHLPGDLIPATLAAVGDDVLIGGFVGSGVERTPAMARGSAADTSPAWQLVSLRPSTPYGKVASLVSLSGDGRSIAAIGAAHGGAHANFRWTIWTGTRAGVADRPQTFETFGGQEAGGLLCVAQDHQGPLIVGTWQGAHGLDGAIWRPAGERWVRQPTPSALANTIDRQVAPRTAAGQSDGSVTINGSVIDLTDGVRQSAAVWRGSGAHWTLTELPDPGKRSEAWSTVCAGTGSAGCWTVGSREGAVAVWSPDPRSSLPELAVGDHDSGVITQYGDRIVAAISAHGQGRLLIGHDGAWKLYSAPDGAVRAAALVGTRLYLVSGPDDGAVLTVRDLADLLTG